MTVKIDAQIVGCEVVKPGIDERGAVIQSPDTQTMTMQPYERPSALYGSTYKITPPTMNAALYVTINDLVLPDGTRRPFEVFLNSKDVTHAQWMTAVTRLLSAVLRQPLPFEFAIAEMKETVDPNGAYFIPKGNPGGKGKCGGIVAHIGRVLEEHCKASGAIKKTEPQAAQKLALAEKKAEAEARGIAKQTCPKCGMQGMVMMDGCLTCVECGDSKCG